MEKQTCKDSQHDEKEKLEEGKALTVIKIH
jgi:hypothetical protein